MATLMAIPVLTELLEFLNNVDLNEPFEFGTDGVPDDFTTDIIRASLVGPSGARIDLTTEDGTIVKTAPGKFQFNVDKAVMWTKPAGVYLFDIIRTSLAGTDNPLLRGKAKLTQGMTPP